MELYVENKDDKNIKKDNNKIEETNSFRYGFNLIFQQWPAFRLSLENTPEALTRYEEIENSDGELEEDLEIIMMLEALEFDILTLLVIIFLPKFHNS